MAFVSGSALFGNKWQLWLGSSFDVRITTTPSPWAVAGLAIVAGWKTASASSNMKPCLSAAVSRFDSPMIGPASISIGTKFQLFG